MITTTRRILAVTASVLVGSTVAGAGALAVGLVAAPASSAAAAHEIAPRTVTAPPWEPDTNSAGALVFFNSSGQEITSGSVNDSPIAAYVEGIGTPHAGDIVATLYGYLPVQADPPVPGEWSGENFNSGTVYPVKAGAGVPTDISSATGPVETGANGDESIAVLESDFPNNSTTPGYEDTYELRLRTADPGVTSSSATYDSADILVSGSGDSATWSVEYAPLPTTTTLTAPATVDKGASETLTAIVASTVAGTTLAPGSVTFYNKGKAIADNVAVSGGKAVFIDKTLPAGAASLTAAFNPTNEGAGDVPAFLSKTSSSRAVAVTVLQTTTTALKASATTITKGKELSLLATVVPAVAGDVYFYNGKDRLAIVKINAKGQAGWDSTKLAAGTYEFVADFVPTNPKADVASHSAVVKVVVKA